MSRLHAGRELGREDRSSGAGGVFTRGECLWCDPTVPPPSLMRRSGPAPAYALIHTSDYIFPETTPIISKFALPGGIYFFEKVLRTFACAFKLSAC